MNKVLYDKRSGIGYATLNRPDALNALDDDINQALWSVWDDWSTRLFLSEIGRRNGSSISVLSAREST